MDDYEIDGPKGNPIVKHATIAQVDKLLPGLLKRFGRVTVRPAPAPKPAEFVMYDSVDITQIPTTAFAAAGYVNGNWPTYDALRKRLPHALLLSIAVTASADADCLDIERGDATPAEAPGWVRRQMARGVQRPAVYCAVSDAPTVLSVLKHAGIKRSQIRLFTAHYNYKQHRCSPLCKFGMWTRADATQFSDRSFQRNLDVSLCAPDFLAPDL